MSINIFPSINEERLQQLYQRLDVFPERNPGLDSRFRELIHNADDDTLSRINAHKLAQQWQLSPRQVLTWLLYAGQVGLFDLNWESHCPHCAGVLDRAHRPGTFKTHGACPTCTSSFELHFDENVVVTFSISPLVRALQPSRRIYIPEEAVELGIYPGGQPIQLDLIASYGYALISDQGDPVALINVAPEYERREALQIERIPGSSTAQRFQVAPGAVTLTASGWENVYVGYLDRTSPRHATVTGLDMAMIPAFQKLFSQDVLSQRESMTIRNLTILFTDITGSTALYQRLGDVRAYNLVRDHFEVLFREIEKLNGTVVKTIGDAVMAAFTTPEAALQAGLEVQKAIGEFNSGRSQEDGLILVKIGMHMGSAIAVNLNERLDYFGNMVNMAARIQGQSRSAEILVSQEVYEDAAVQQLLKAHPNIRISESVFELAGIEKSQRLFSIAHAAKWH